MSTHGAALNRWRLVLGKARRLPFPWEAASWNEWMTRWTFSMSVEAGPDVRRDPEGGQGESQPSVARWLSEVRDLFPQETAEILQRHALDRYHLTALLTDQEVLEQLEPDEGAAGNGPQSEGYDEGAGTGCRPADRGAGGTGADRKNAA